MASIPKILITILVVSAVVVGFNLSLTDFNNQYSDFEVGTELQSSLDVFNETLSETQSKTLDLQNRSSGTQASQETDSGLNLQNALGAVKLSYDSFGIVNDMIQEVSKQLKINTIWTWVLLGVLTITISFLIISAILKNPL